VLLAQPPPSRMAWEGTEFMHLYNVGVNDSRMEEDEVDFSISQLKPH